MVLRATIAGCGGYLPERRLSNDELAALHGIATSDAWIRERTGIGFRHMAAPDETASDMGAAAAREALAHAGLDATELDAILVATSTPDSAFPATAVRIQSKTSSMGSPKKVSAPWDSRRSRLRWIAPMEAEDTWP